MRQAKRQKDKISVPVKPAPQKRMSPKDERSLRIVLPLLFFGCFFVFLLRYLDPAIIFSSNGFDIHNYVAAMHAQETSPQNTPAYSNPPIRHPFILELAPAFARNIAGTPGGATRLIVTLCIYACRYPVAGALAVTGLALFFFWIIARYFMGIGVQRPYVFRFVPAFFLMSTCAWYELRYCAFLLPVAGALTFAVGYRRLRPNGAWTRALWLSALFWSAWYLMQWGCLLLLVFVVIHEMFSRKRGKASVVITSAVNAALLCSLDAWFLPLDMTIQWSDFTAMSGLPLVVIGFFPLSALVLAAWDRFRPVTELTLTPIGAIVRTSFLVCCIAAAVVWLCKDPVNRDTRTIARTAFHVLNGQWEAILNEKTGAIFAGFPKRATALQEFMVHAVDHSLCSTGRLGDRLFAFPQAGFSVSQLLMLESTHTKGYVNWIVALELAMDLGMVNVAEKLAGEIMENVGPFPDIIYRRALVQIAKGNTEAAAVYLNKLARMPYYRTEAKRLLGLLDTTEALVSEPRIASMRANMDTTDYFLFTVSYDAMLKHLLQSNPGNKAAYDYLMTFCLLTGRLDGLAALIPAAPAYGYTELPRYWEEALCVYRAANATPALTLSSNSMLRPETVERFNEFAQACMQMTNDPDAEAKLAPAFGDSYYYFSIFKHSNGVRHE